jgi:hypothetical protein
MNAIARLRLVGMGMALVLAAACSGGAAPSGGPALPDSAGPSPATPPEPTATPFPSPTLVTVGPAEVVFDWSKDRCEALDIPDLPARAFRDVDGNVQLISSHLKTRRAIGPDLNDVKHECEPVMQATHDGDPSKFSDNEWIASTYTEDGSTIYAIVSNEFHGWEHGMCTAKDNFACWYNANTLVVSHDAGKSYEHAATPPGQLIAALPEQYEDGAGPYGAMEPSNIIKKDGYYYAFVRIDEYKSDAQRLCLMRTDNLSDASSWRAWDGTDFTVVFHDPYADAEAAKTAPACAAMDLDLGLIGTSITYNTYLNRYVMMGLSTDNFSTDREIWGVMYAFSDDLIEWDRRILLFEAPLPWSRQDGNPRVYLYASLLDPDSTSRNFETAGKTAYLYLTRFNGGDPLDRDIIRIPVEFFPTKAEAKTAEVAFQP